MSYYIILSNSRINKGEKLALVDRNKTKNQWWTQDVNKIMIFNSKDAAETQCSKLKFNNPQVWEYAKGIKRLSQVLVKVQTESTFSKALRRKAVEWHDDDWHEQMNS